MPPQRDFVATRHARRMYRLSLHTRQTSVSPNTTCPPNVPPLATYTPNICLTQHDMPAECTASRYIHAKHLSHPTRHARQMYRLSLHVDHAKCTASRYMLTMHLTYTPNTWHKARVITPSHPSSLSVPLHWLEADILCFRGNIRRLSMVNRKTILRDNIKLNVLVFRNPRLVKITSMQNMLLSGPFTSYYFQKYTICRLIKIF